MARPGVPATRCKPAAPGESWLEPMESRLLNVLIWSESQARYGLPLCLGPPGRLGTAPPQRAHLARVPFAVKENEALYSLAVGHLSPERIMLEPHHFTHLIQKFELGVGNEAIPGNRRLCFFNIEAPFPS